MATISTAADVQASDALTRLGFWLSDRRADRPDGRAAHRVTAVGRLGSIDVEASSKEEAFAEALVEAWRLLDMR